MPREIKMPKLSDTMEEGTLNVWRKREGERIQKGDVLLEVETDKADMEFEAYMSGTLEKILVQAGVTVPVGTPIAIVRLESDSDADVQAFLASREVAAGGAPATAAPAAAMGRAAPAAARPVVPAPGPAPLASMAASAPPFAAPIFSSTPLPPPAAKLPFFFPDPARVRATPRARLLAQERGVDLSEIAGSGPDGAVLVPDVERYLEALETQAEPLLHGDVAVTPVAQRIADELHIDLSRVKGTGPGGRITKRDLRDHLDREARGGSARELELFGDEVKLSQKRKFLIRNMVESKRTAPHFYLSMEVDAEPLGALRERLKAEGKRITYTHMIVKACALALEGMPEANATYREDRILRFSRINIGVAVDVQDELVAPVLKSCQGRDLEDLALALDALIAKARERKLTPGDYSDGTFTVSNLGMFGVDRFYAILTPPQSMVLSVGALRSEPVADGDRVRVGRCISFGLGVDHRVLDGVKAAQFLAEVKRLIEAPEVLLARSAAHGD
jgi:pyruvate dehydrogenase E2 component (dihydrolipoamide acetyltransferase)